MAYFLSVICALGVPMANLTGHAQAQEGSPFSLQVQVFEALESGPLVLRVTLTYRGAREITVFSSNLGSNFSVDLPRTWDLPLDLYMQRHLGVCVGRLYGVRTLKPGDRWTQIGYLHHDCAIPAGEFRVSLSWPIHLLQDGENWDKSLAKPTLTLKLRIPNATNDRVRALATRLQARLAKHPGIDEARAVGKTVRFAHHRGLIPVYLRLMKTGAFDQDFFGIVEDMYEVFGDKTSAKEALLSYLLENEACFPPIFSYWRHTKVELSAEDLQKLLHAPSPWLRIGALASFPGKCGDPERHMLGRVRDEVSMPSDELRTILRSKETSF